MAPENFKQINGISANRTDQRLITLNCKLTNEAQCSCKECIIHHNIYILVYIYIFVTYNYKRDL